jgi:hypothetical protein
LSLNWNEASFRISVPSSSQSGSGKSQWENLLSHKEMPFQAEAGKMG